MLIKEAQPGNMLMANVGKKTKKLTKEIAEENGASKRYKCDTSDTTSTIHPCDCKPGSINWIIQQQFRCPTCRF